MQKQNYQQIDVIKGFAIVSVLLLHSLPEKTILNTYSVFHIWQAVPIFMVLMGLNAGMALPEKDRLLAELYSRKYFQKKFKRIVVPVILVFLGSILVGLAWWGITGVNKLDFRASNLMGVLPVPGPGNYFITLVLQSVLLLPLIKFGFRHHAYITLITLVVLEVLFLLIADDLRLFTRNNYLYSAALPRYFSAIAFGLVLSKFIFRPARTTKIILITSMAVISSAYLLEITYRDLEIPGIKPEWEAQNVLTFSYAAFIILVLFKLLPQQSDNWFLKGLAALGVASYHIFLVQIVYFGLIPPKTNVLLNLTICLGLGLLFCRKEYILQTIFTRKEKKVDPGK